MRKPLICMAFMEGKFWAYISGWYISGFQYLNATWIINTCMSMINRSFVVSWWSKGRGENKYRSQHIILLSMMDQDCWELVDDTQVLPFFAFQDVRRLSVQQTTQFCRKSFQTKSVLPKWKSCSRSAHLGNGNTWLCK